MGLVLSQPVAFHGVPRRTLENAGSMDMAAILAGTKQPKTKDEKRANLRGSSGSGGKNCGAGADAGASAGAGASGGSGNNGCRCGECGVEEAPDIAQQLVDWVLAHAAFGIRKNIRSIHSRRRVLECGEPYYWHDPAPLPYTAIP